VPLIADDDLLGVLSLQGERDPASPDPAERTAAAAAALAGELSAALRATRLERESARAERLGDAVSALGACKEPRELWEAITTWAVSLLEAESAILRLVDESTGRLRIVAWNGVGQWQRSAVAELERKLSNEAMTTQRLIRVADLQTDPSFAFLAVGVSTAMTQALLRDGETLGSLTVLGKVPQDPLLGERFDPSDEPVLERLSQHAVGALLAFRQPERPDVDSVTGLPKRAPLRERLGGELARSRMRGHALALLELHFDGLDDTPAPDALAIELAHGLREALREFDLLCRPESDRFAVLVPEPDQDVTRVISELCRHARGILDVHEDDATGVELRVGYAVFPQDGDTPEALEARASDCRVVPA
jgi:GGDEF domain-containing protein